MTFDLKERARAVMRQELASAAFDLVLENGYEQTAEELADALGISRATFFRHLGSKEDIVVAAMLGSEDLFAAAFSQARHARSVSTWQRLKAAFQPIISDAEATPERVRARLALVRTTPVLGARLQRARRPQVDRLVGALVEQGHDALAANALAAAAVAVFDRCWLLWAGDESLVLRQLVDRAFAQLDAASLPDRAG
ncbi:TetR/AcrR family transcriptional regulator [Devosia sp. A449]